MKKPCEHKEIFPFGAFLIKGKEPKLWLLFECPDCGVQTTVKGDYLELMEEVL